MAPTLAVLGLLSIYVLLNKAELLLFILKRLKSPTLIRVELHTLPENF